MDGWYFGQRVLTLSPAVVGPPHHSPGWRARQKLVGQVEDVHQKLSDSDFHLLSVPEVQFCFGIRFQNNIEAAKTDWVARSIWNIGEHLQKFRKLCMRKLFCEERSV